ncbi:MAG: hypothetical protein IJS39_07105 [Synergistaceae bacterium]|nr:hypothetical protein [Synergistaceae bacterium]
MSRPDTFPDLSPESTLIYFLRTLFTSGAEYAVYIPNSGDVIVLTSGQLSLLVERGCADAMIKSLPQLVLRNIVQPVNLESIEYPQELRALYVTNTGSFAGNLETALYPDEPQYPEWWNAPVPFALSSRGLLRLNDTAKSMFGAGLEQMNAHELPERDEFIVRLDGLNGTRFIAFRKLRAGIFTIDDCTEDLTDAQDITWWAAVGQTWVKEIESQGGKWQRLSEPPQEKGRAFRACEWQGEIQGYLVVEMPSRKKKVQPQKSEPEKPSVQAPAPEAGQVITEQYEPTIKSPDDVIGSIGPQAMALLASGQARENEGGTDFQL